MLSQENMNGVFRGTIIGKDIVFYNSLSSTNDRALEIGRSADAPEGIVIVADSQTRGRGRMGREWVSPAGSNLYFSVILQPPLPKQELTIIPLAAAVSAVTAIKDYLGLSASIKWPNDIVINNKKAGGILVESKSVRDKTELLIIGIGINVNMTLDMLPDDIRDLSTSLMIEHGSTVNRIELLGKLLEALESTYTSLLKEDPQRLISSWSGMISTIGQSVSVQVHKDILSGTAEDITASGELILRLSDGTHKVVRSGDVTLVKK